MPLQLSHPAAENPLTTLEDLQAGSKSVRVDIMNMLALLSSRGLPMRLNTDWGALTTVQLDASDRFPLSLATRRGHFRSRPGDVLPIPPDAQQISWLLDMPSHQS